MAELNLPGEAEKLAKTKPETAQVYATLAIYYELRQIREALQEANTR